MDEEPQTISATPTITPGYLKTEFKQLSSQPSRAQGLSS